MAQGKKYNVNEKDKELVIQMSSVGISHEQIAAVIGITHDTLVKYYKIELDTSKSKAIAKIGGRLYQKALKGDNTCMIFYLKTQARWHETQHLIHEDKEYVISDEVLTIEQFDEKYSIKDLAATAKTEDPN